VGVRESHTFRREPVDVGRGDLALGIQAPHVAVTEIVGKN
jgi:hypothetical protein